MRVGVKWVIAATIVMVVGLSSFLLVRAYTQTPSQTSAVMPVPQIVSANRPIATQPNLSNAASIFQPIASKLKRSPTPPRLPTYIPRMGQFPLAPGEKAPAVYANVSETQPPQGYLIILGSTPDCSGGNVCRFGMLQGIPQPIQSIEQTYLPDQDPSILGKRSSEPMSQVSLSRGIQGWFIPWLCVSSCSDAKVVWDEDRYRYEVGIKVGDKASLVKMANSAIGAGGQ